MQRLIPRLESLEERCTPAIYTVKNLHDSGVGSLRQAILNANNHAGQDSVAFKAGLEGTIRLTGIIVIDDSVTITGPGAAKLAISGNFNSRIFNVNDLDAGVQQNVTIRGLEFRHGRESGGGGAIFSTESLKLVRTVFTQNHSDSSGGAIYSEGSLTVKQSKLAGNTAGNFGGAIYCDGSATISDTTISTNQALGDGGGVYCTDSLTVSDSTISGNRASGDGGGILSNTAIINGATIAGNTAADDGGGIYCNAAIISGSTLAFNSADSNGGGLLVSSSPVASVIANSTFSGNQSGNNGGGLWSNTSSMTVRNSTIAFNRAVGFGGGMFVENLPAVLESCLIADNDGATDDKDIESIAAIFTLHHCLIGVHDDVTIAGTFIQKGTVTNPLDARLAPLANNGGKTQTHALKKGSPAINAGSNPAGLTKDQRGGPFQRNVNGVDIGAFERQ